MDLNAWNLNMKSSSRPIYMMSLPTLLLARRCTLLGSRIDGVFEDAEPTGYISSVICLSSKEHV